jgi:hypothetical protein
MAEGNKGGGNTFLAFVLGAVVIVVGVIAWFVFDGAGNGGDGQVEAPASGEQQSESQSQPSGGQQSDSQQQQ